MLASLGHFCFLHHVDESNTFFEATDLPSVTFLMIQCDDMNNLPIRGINNVHQSLGGLLTFAMGKKDLTEQEIRSQYIRPAIVDAGWEPAEIREEYHFTLDRT